MAYFITTSSAFDTALADRSEAKYLRLLIDNDADEDFSEASEDYTDYIFEGQITGGGRRTGSNDEAVSNSWRVSLDNRSHWAAEGDFAGAKCAVEAQAGSEGYIRIFTGYVSSKGAKRSVGRLTEDTLTLDLIDLIEKRGTKVYPDPCVLVGYKVCDPSDTGASIFHHLAAVMGFEAADCDTGTISDVVEVVALDGRKTAWAELQTLAAQYLGLLTITADEKLRFRSRHESGWSEPASEYTLDSSNVHRWTAQPKGLLCNRVYTEYSDYEELDTGVVYWNATGYSKATGQIEIEVAAGAYWPGPNSGDKAQLKYSSKDTGEKYPFARNITTPTIGATGSGSDIECEGGTLTLLSFNGSTSATQQNMDSSELILWNNTGSTITIRKLQLRGTPYRITKSVRVQDQDDSADPEDIIEKKIDGKYVSGQLQAHETTQWWYEWGSENRTGYTVRCDWLPQVQEGAVVTFEPPGESSTITAVVDSFKHPAVRRSAQKYTELVLVEKDTITTSGNGEVTESPEVQGPEQVIDQVTPSYEDIESGYDRADEDGNTVATTTPATPEISEVASNFRDIMLAWESQPTLTNLLCYQIQCRTHGTSTWYAPRNDYETSGQWYNSTADSTLRVDGNIFAHRRIPNAGTADVPESRIVDYRIRAVTRAALQSDGSLYTDAEAPGAYSDWSDAAIGYTYPLEPGDIGEDIITAAKVAAGAIVANAIAAGAITAGKIAAGAVEAVKIAAGAVSADKLAAGAVTADKIAADAVTATKIDVSTLSAIAANIGTVTAGMIQSTDGNSYFDLTNGEFVAVNAELIGTLRTGMDTADDARVAIRDGSGIISGPTFSGSGIDDLGIASEGTVSGEWDVEITYSGTTLPAYSVGDTGPAGGTIIYDRGFTSNGWRYLEAWSSDEGGEYEWGPYETTNAEGSNHGEGYENTYNYLDDNDFEAAYVCANATHGGYSDWFLPAEETAKLMASLGVISGEHWSSTAGTYMTAYTSRGDTEYRDETLPVRAVRRFAVDPDEFRWRKDSGTWSSSIVIPSNNRYSIPDAEITISFTEVYGRTVGDTWTFEQGSMRGISIRVASGEEVFSVGGGGLKMENLPTSDPGVSGQFWNDSGTVKVSSG